MTNSAGYKTAGKQRVHKTASKRHQHSIKDCPPDLHQNETRLYRTSIFTWLLNSVSDSVRHRYRFSSALPKLKAVMVKTYSDIIFRMFIVYMSIYIYRHIYIDIVQWHSGFCFCSLCRKQISCRMWWIKELQKWTLLFFSYLQQMIYCWLQSVEINQIRYRMTYLCGEAWESALVLFRCCHFPLQGKVYLLSLGSRRNRTLTPGRCIPH